MAAGVAEEVKRLQFGETREGFETDAAQLQEQRAELLPIALCRLYGQSCSGPKLLRASAEIAANLTLPYRLHGETEGHLRLLQHILHVGLGEGVAGIVTAAQRGNLLLEGADGGGDHVVKGGDHVVKE